MSEDRKNPEMLDDSELDPVAGGAWTGEETELTAVCAGCRGIRKWHKEYGTWRCNDCNGKEMMSYFDLTEEERRH